MTRYDESRPQVWRVPLRDAVRPDVVVTLPRAGYLVPPAWRSVVEPRLQVHGIAYRALETARQAVAVQQFQVGQARFAPSPSEGRQRVALQGAWAQVTRDIGAGALFVPIAQAKARLVANLLEPQAPDALAAWGDMNNAFEQKEYMLSLIHI